MKKISLAAALLTAIGMSVTAYAADQPAFPGAEGGGKYTKGARGSSSRSVYHVTNLNASGSGSFADAVSKGGRIIVFDVGGTIELNGTLSINKGNLTILGQTAPGDGITFSGGDILLANGVQNVIMRYLRVRPTDKNGGEPDGIGGRWNKNIIIDHCSMSWSVDELMTLYAGSSESKTPGSNLTVQNCIAAESLRMSNHFKGAHGYGGIVGATNSSWLNNLYAHHDSRSPRLDRELQGTDFKNNVIYDWGNTNSAYGAEPYSYNNKTQKGSMVNWINNYYKYGPGTGAALKSRIFDVSNNASVKPYAKFCFSGNYMYGNTTVTNNNTLGINNIDKAELLTEQIDMGKYSYTERTADEAYEYVLSNAGATLPKRDAVDARIINDVKNQTGRIINSANEVGGLIKPEETTRVFSIPDEWKTKHNLTPYKETDIISGGEFDGYTLIEAYVNDWTAQQELPTNPMITVLSPAVASVESNVNGYDINNGNWAVAKTDEEIFYNAVADPIGNTSVTKMELYDKNSLISTYNGNEISDSFSLGAGVHYLTCRAYNDKGEASQSTTSIVYVNSSDSPGSYEFANIGNGEFGDSGSASLDTDTGIYTVSGSGKMLSGSSGVNSDSCGFMYKKIAGDFDVSVRIEDIPKFENYEVSGLMVRAGLNGGSVMAMVADGWLKYGENVRVISRASEGSRSKETYFKNSSGTTLNNTDQYNTQDSAYAMPKYMRIKRNGSQLEFSVSNSGTAWTDNARQPLTIDMPNLPDEVYIGIAADSAQGVPVKEYFAQAKYSRLTINGETDIEFDDYKVPFTDRRFNNAALTTESASMGFEADCSNSPISGNDGYILELWSYASRHFNEQSSGIVRTSVDYLTNGDKKPEADDTVFSVRGPNSEDIVKLNIHLSDGFSINDEGFGGSISGNVWYKVETILDYESGKGIIRVKPYTIYNASSGIYNTSDSIFEKEFNFDTSIPTSSIYYERLGGWIKYFDNISVSVDYTNLTPKLYINDGKIFAQATEDGNVYIAVYDDDRLSYAKKIPIASGEKYEKSIPEGTLKAMLWNNSNEPQTSAVEQ